ncbi:MAG: hypothetical protein JNM47_12070 [Hyphomonadaceae bacterium]|jgi:hypothetical protein|nr:hypothetical protein [Hyphomonadaceae bacterium]
MRSTIFVIAAALAFSLSGIALACSCRPLADAAEHAANSDAIFRGSVIASIPDPARPDFFSITTFQIIAPLKWPSGWDAPPETIEVRHASAQNGPHCAIWYEPATTALVVARVGQDRLLHTSSCDAPRWPEADYRAALHLAAN